MANPAPFTFGDVVRILVICLVGGFIISSLGIAPIDFWIWVRDTLEWAWRHAVDILRKGAEYIVIGAAVVVPVVLLRYAWVWFKKK
jgi:hypothetical protein